MDPDLELVGRPRRWTHALVAASVVAVRAASVSFVLTREDPPAERSAGPTTTTLRPCVEQPAAEPPTDLDDVVYAGRITPVSNVTAVDLWLDNGGAGTTLTDLPVAEDVEVSGAPADSWSAPPAASPARARAAVNLVAFLGGGVSVQLDRGVITRFDLLHLGPDDTFGRGEDPCRPTRTCPTVDGPIVHTWPGGVDGRLGDDVSGIPDRIAASLAKWGLDVEASSMTRRGCEVAVSGIARPFTVRMARTDDGYVLTGASTTPAPASHPTADPAADPAAEPAVVERQPDSVRFTLARWSSDPTVSVTAMVRFGDRSAKADAAAGAAELQVPVRHRASQVGSFVLVARTSDDAVLDVEAAPISGSDAR